jgi:iron-sulfur cluster assembly protein/iron-sulfur cluster insertion protein
MRGAYLRLKGSLTDFVETTVGFPYHDVPNTPTNAEEHMTAPDITRRVDIPLSPKSSGVTLTSAATAKVKALIDAEGDPELSLRIAVKRSGCSGYAYDMFFDTVVDPSDVVSEIDDVRVLIDGSSIEMVSGAIVDFKDDGLAGAGFSIDNPNSSGTCGCGKSFS